MARSRTHFYFLGRGFFLFLILSFFLGWKYLCTFNSYHCSYWMPLLRESSVKCKYVQINDTRNRDESMYFVRLEWRTFNRTFSNRASLKNIRRTEKKKPKEMETTWAVTTKDVNQLTPPLVRWTRLIFHFLSVATMDLPCEYMWNALAICAYNESSQIVCSRLPHENRAKIKNKYRITRIRRINKD